MEIYDGFILQAMILGVIADRSLSLSLAPVIVDVAKALAQDKKALTNVRLSRTTASYKLTHGLGHNLKESLCQDLRSYPYSCNMDESTSNSYKKVLGRSTY